MIIPTQIQAGATLALAFALTAYPADEWTVSLHMRGQGAIDLTATADGTSYRLDATAAATALWSPGRYSYAVRATDGVDVVELESGSVVVLVDLVGAGADYDDRSTAERTLAAIEAVIEGRAAVDQESYRINNRELRRTPIADLLKLRAVYAARVQRERDQARGRTGVGRLIRMVMP